MNDCITEKELTLLKSSMNAARKSLLDKPEGCLRICQKKNSCHYYYRSSPHMSKGTYLRKDQISLVIALAQKRYDQKFLVAACDLEKLIQKSQGYNGIDKHTFYQILGGVYQNLSPARQKLVTPYILPDKQFLEAWLNLEYEGKPSYKEKAEIKTVNGEYVRSKSEKIIADMLYSLHIPYKYEYPLKTKTWGIVYPDFTLLDLWTRTLVILEHFGRLEDPSYSLSAIKKIETYDKEGYHLGDNFLFTMESENHIINIKYLEDQINRRFPHAADFVFS